MRNTDKSFCETGGLMCQTFVRAVSGKIDKCPQRSSLIGHVVKCGSGNGGSQPKNRSATGACHRDHFAVNERYFIQHGFPGVYQRM